MDLHAGVSRCSCRSDLCGSSPSQQHRINSLLRTPSQKPQINNAIFYLNSYLCEAKSSPEMFVLFMSFREEQETNHLVQCVFVCMDASAVCVSVKYVRLYVCIRMCVLMFGEFMSVISGFFVRLKKNLHVFMCECMFVHSSDYLRGKECVSMNVNVCVCE